MAAGFLLAVGCLWALFVMSMFVTIAGIADAPESWAKPAIWLGGMLVGPFVLMIGAVLLLRGTSLRAGAILVGLGCIILTGLILYSSIVGMQQKPLQSPPPYLFFAVLLLLMLLSDVVAYKVYRASR